MVDPVTSSNPVAPTPVKPTSVQPITTTIASATQANRMFPLGDDSHHVLENVLQLNQDSQVHEAFYHSGIDNPDDLATYNLATGPEEILTFTEEFTGIEIFASRHRLKLHKLVAFVHWNQEHGKSRFEYGTMTLDDFDVFRSDGRLKQMSEEALVKQNIYTKPPPGPSTQTTPCVDERAKNFTRGIKRDARYYKVISDVKQMISIHTESGIHCPNY
jgi:hypothetical protein